MVLPFAVRFIKKYIYGNLSEMQNVSAKKSVALSSVFASAALTTMKAVVGFATGSMGILSEAAHSALDLGAAALTYFAVSESDKPADEKHHYGHGKIESLSAFIETLLLFITSAWIIYEAVQRFFEKNVEVTVEWYSFAVIIISIVVDISRSRALSRVAKQTGSLALEADALHFSSDIWSSGAVLIGLAFVLFDIKGADAVAALVVAVFIVVAGIKLGKRTIEVLIDTAPVGTKEKITEIVGKIDGVVGVDKIKVRPAGVALIIEIALVVGRNLSLEQLNALIKNVEKHVLAEFPESEITVVAKPVALSSETIAERVHIVAKNHALEVHDVAVHFKGKKKSISFDVEVPHNMCVKDAHAKATHLEEEIKKELGADVEITTHIEPINKEAISDSEVSATEQSKIEKMLQKIAHETAEVKDLHDVAIVKSNGKYFVNVHCVFADSLSIEKAHSTASRIEFLARQKMPAIAKVVVHSEPVEELPQ